MNQQHPKKSRSSLLYCLISLSSIIMLIGCGGNPQFKEKLIALDSLLIEYPDSVYHVLGDMKEEASTQSESSRMYYELLRADAQNKAYIDFTTDSVMKIVAEYYDKHGNSNEQMRAHYLLGCTYRDLKDVPMELQCFQDAVEKADTTIRDCAWGRLASIYGQMADLYHFQFLPDEELKALSKCEIYDRLNNDKYAAIKSYELRLRAYFIMNMPDSVLSISRKARERYLSIGDTIEAARLLAPAIGILIDQEKYNEAYEYMQLFENAPFYKDSLGNINRKNVIHLYDKGRFDLHKNDIVEAKEAFCKLMDYGYKEAAYKGFLLLYEKIGNADSIAKYAKLFADANDSSFIDNNADIVAQMSAVYNYSSQKRNAEKANIQLLVEKRKSDLYLIVIVAFILACAVLVYIYKKRHRMTIEKIKELNQDIEHKNSLLYEAGKNDNELELRSLRKSLETTQRELQKYKQSDALAAFLESDIFKLFHKVGKTGRNSITREEWEIMMRKFNSSFSHYSDFILSGKSMTEDQIKICMLIRLGFSESAMANILNVDLKRISRIKLQINQKLFGIANAKDLGPNLKTKF